MARRDDDSSGPVLSFRAYVQRNTPARNETAKPPARAGKPGRHSPAMPPAPASSFSDVPTFEVSDEYVELKLRLHRELIERINLAALERLQSDELQSQIGDILRDMLANEQTPLNVSERNKLINDVVDEFLGLGPLEPLLKDPTVSDILVNTYTHVYVERRGMLEITNIKFKDNAHLLRIIERIVMNVGRRIDESHPTVDARLADGSRINAVIPPIAVDGPLLSVRKFSKVRLDLDKLVEFSSITTEMAEMLSWVVRCRLNVLISGGTGSGKTTLLNAMSGSIPNDQRIVTIEDAAELQLQQDHVVRMETRPPNVEGKGEITQRHLVKNALRMRPDRIIVGEVRAGEAFDMLQAMNTGHDGSMTTIHANSPRDASKRLEQMIGMAGLDLPMLSIRSQIASAIDVIIQARRLSDGSRKIVSISEVLGMENDVITMQEIVRFEQVSMDAEGRVIGQFVMTGNVPHFLEKIHTMGGDLQADMFVSGML